MTAISAFYSKQYPLLWDSSTELHRLLNLTKRSLALRQDVDKSLGEWVLQSVGYADFPDKETVKLDGMNASIESDPTKRYVHHIHANKKEEIESRWNQPIMTDEEVGEVLFEDLLQDNLEKLIESAGMSVNIKL